MDRLYNLLCGAELGGDVGDAPCQSKREQPQLMSLNCYGACKSVTLTNLQYISDSSLIQEPHALAKRGVLILESICSAPTWGAVHPDVSFISGKCPEDKTLLDRLRNAGESFLYSLEWNCFGNKFRGDVKQSARRQPLNSIFSLPVGS